MLKVQPKSNCVHQIRIVFQVVHIYNLTPNADKHTNTDSAGVAVKWSIKRMVQIAYEKDKVCMLWIITL
jgi:hypothetical protein